MENIDSLATAIFTSVKDYCDAEMSRRIEKLTDSFEQRLGELFLAIPPAAKDGKDGKDGVDGKDAPVLDPEELDKMIFECVATNLEKAVEALPKPIDGADALVDYELIRAEIAKMIPAPIAGEKGRDGKDASVDYPLIISEVAKLIPAPLHGEKGDSGPAGERGAPGERGADAVLDKDWVTQEIAKLIPSPIPGVPGEKGSDGKDAEVDYERIAKWCATNLKPAESEEWKKAYEGLLDEVGVTDINVEILEREVAALKARPVPKDGKDGSDGKDGKDGVDAVVDYEIISSEIAKLIPAPIRGEAGPAGEKGEKGEHGEKGDMGVAVKGDKGDPGEVDYDMINEFIANHIPDPIPGEKGKDGEKGERGERGEKGAQGDEGVPGAPGQDGTHGQDGKNGVDGKDALEIDPLPVIDEERSYARGTWACYRGGWVKALRNTDPLCESSGIEKAGWAVMNEGIAEVAVDMGEDLRTFAVGVELTSGKTVVKTFTLPVVLYRGTYKKGDKYARGDSVTWGNQQYVALKDTEQEPMPVGTGDWQLAIKKGRDGKDGKDGTIGPPGIPGQRGRDLTHLGPNGEKY